MIEKEKKPSHDRLPNLNIVKSDKLFNLIPHPGLTDSRCRMGYQMSHLDSLKETFSFGRAVQTVTHHLQGCDNVQMYTKVHQNTL